MRSHLADATASRRLLTFTRESGSNAVSDPPVVRCRDRKALSDESPECNGVCAADARLVGTWITKMHYTDAFHIQPLGLQTSGPVSLLIDSLQEGHHEHALGMLDRRSRPLPVPLSCYEERVRCLSASRRPLEDPLGRARARLLSGCRSPRCRLRYPFRCRCDQVADLSLPQPCADKHHHHAATHERVLHSPPHQAPIDRRTVKTASSTPLRVAHSHSANDFIWPPPPGTLLVG